MRLAASILLAVVCIGWAVLLAEVTAAGDPGWNLPTMARYLFVPIIEGIYLPFYSGWILIVFSRLLSRARH
ncbi:hypothetical protein GCM10007148_12350 [Parvularcula lutaonensis]|nr:hypothetical protein GCM10007148_12350 [Parvularcula lutaonensis]